MKFVQKLCVFVGAALGFAAFATKIHVPDDLSSYIGLPIVSVLVGLLAVCLVFNLRRPATTSR